MEKEKNYIPIITIILIIVIVVAFGAFYFGKNSNNNKTQISADTSNQTSSSNQLSPIASSQPEAQKTTPQTLPTTIQTKPKQATQAVVITNSQPCLEIANQAVQSEEASGIMSGTKVLQAHFKQSLNNCYYEIQYPMSGDTITSIHYAPNDQTIATCAQLSKSCYQSDYGYINESAFHLIEAQYLAN